MKTVNYDTIKVLKRRDSATSVLRKLGIKPCDYNFFIEKMEDGRFACQVGRAEQHLETQKGLKTKSVRTSIDGSKISMTAFCKQEILNGKSNQEIYQMMVEYYGDDITEEKKYYPSWNRCELRRKGLLPAAFDNHNHNGNVEIRME
jgi:hypothetical protein